MSLAETCAASLWSPKRMCITALRSPVAISLQCRRGSRSPCLPFSNVVGLELSSATGSGFKLSLGSPHFVKTPDKPRLARQISSPSPINTSCIIIWLSSVLPDLHALLQPTIEKAVRIQLLSLFMFARLNQLSRHLSRPLPNYTHSSAATSRPLIRTSIMAIAEEKTKRMIHTAGCIIIGDEVLGGKVCFTYTLNFLS